MATSGFDENNKDRQLFGSDDQCAMCDPFIDLLYKRVDLLSEQEWVDLQTHLEVCAECCDEYEFIQNLFQTGEREEPPRDTRIAEQNRQKLFAYYEELYGQSPSIPLSVRSPSEVFEQPEAQLKELHPTPKRVENEEPIIIPSAHPPDSDLEQRLAAMVQHNPDPTPMFNKGENVVSVSIHYWQDLTFHLGELRPEMIAARLKKKIGIPIWCLVLIALILCALGVRWLAMFTQQAAPSPLRYKVNIQPTSAPAVPRELSRQVRPSGWVHTVVWSPKAYANGGRTIALLWTDNIAQVWSVDEQRELFHVVVGWGQGLAFSPDGKHLATVGKEDSTFQVLDVGECIIDPTNCIADANHIFRGHSNWINALSWSPDGKYIASASADDTVSIWDASNNALPISTYRNPASYSDNDESSHQYTTVAWSPDGTRIATGDDMGNVQIWKARVDRKPLTAYHSPSGIDPVTSVSWSPNSTKGRYIVSAGYRGLAYIWDTQTGQLHTTLVQKGNPNAANSTHNPIYSVAWSPTTSDVIALASYNVTQFYQTDGTLIGEYDFSQNISQEGSNLFTVAWSPDGNQLAIGGQGIVLNIELRRVNP